MKSQTVKKLEIMTYQELRIGNLVYVPKDNKIHEVSGVYKFGVTLDYIYPVHDKKFEGKGIFYGFEDIEPIFITESLLHKLGFKRTDIVHSDKSVSPNVFVLNSISAQRPIGWTKYKELEFIICKVDYQRNIKYLKGKHYVHQLQNLFFELEEKELTLKKQ